MSTLSLHFPKRCTMAAGAWRQSISMVIEYNELTTLQALVSAFARFFTSSWHKNHLLCKVQLVTSIEEAKELIIAYGEEKRR